MSRLGRPLLSWQFGCKVPEKVPEKTPGAWLTKLSMMAPGLREREEELLPLLGLVVELQFASGHRTGATGLAWLMLWLDWLDEGWW